MLNTFLVKTVSTRRTCWLSALIIVLLLGGCGHALPPLPDFDAARWRNDPYGCKNQRAALLPVIEKHRDVLYGARINDIVALFGHPDEEELGEQSDKIYIYYVTSGMQCAQGHPRASHNRLRIRSGATGTVTELLIPVLRKDTL